MTDVLKHRFVSPKIDGADTQQVQPSHWNEGHRFLGGADGQVLTRDATDLSFGAKWAPIPTEIPAGGTNGDVLTRDSAVPIIGTKWAPTQSGLQNVVTITNTGTINDLTVAGLAGKDTWIDWDGASPALITGITGGVQGQLLTIRCRGAGPLTIAHYSASSTVGNRFINYVGSAPTPLMGGGSAQWIYFSGSWYLLWHEQGAWITPPFSAADYSGTGSMTWTVAAGNVQTCRYHLAGRKLSWGIYLSDSVIGGTVGPVLKRNIPGGFSCPVNSYIPGVVTGTNGTTFAGLLRQDSSQISFFHDPGGISNFVAGTCYIQAAGFSEVA